MLIFRWEHAETGNGPLCGMNPIDGVDIDDIFAYHSAPIESKLFRNYIRDNPIEVFSLKMDGFVYDRYKDYFFAWNCIDKFSDSLIDDAENYLKNSNFIPVIYEVNEKFVVLEDGQVFFDKTAATRIGVI